MCLFGHFATQDRDEVLGRYSRLRQLAGVPMQKGNY